jgi:hypothetical protein
LYKSYRQQQQPLIICEIAQRAHVKKYECMESMYFGSPIKFTRLNIN